MVEPGAKVEKPGPGAAADFEADRWETREIGRVAHVVAGMLADDI